MRAHHRRLLRRRPPPRHARRRSAPSPGAVVGLALFVGTMSIATAATYTLPPVVASADPVTPTTTAPMRAPLRAPSPDGLIIPGPPRPAAATVPVLTGAVPSTTAPTTTTAPPPPRVEPASLAIASIGVSTPLIRLGLQEDGTLEVPEDFRVAGWWTGGAAPGEVGPAVLAGHVDSYIGPGVFARLATVTPGAAVEVTRADGTPVRFLVTRVARYPKDAFPTNEVYGPTTVPELRIITCGGAFDPRARSYLDNVVVYAAAAPA